MSLRVGDGAHGRLVAMLDDPECVDKVLLVGVALIALVDLGRQELSGTRHLEKLVHRTRVGRGWWIKDVIGGDARTYKPPSPDWAATCEAPMVRRDGYCGSDRGHHWLYLVDYATGERRVLSYCSRHRDWAHDVQRANRDEAPDPAGEWGGAPLPVANHGGILARHFPEIDWPELWRKCHPHWTEHPEGQLRPQPRFSLIVGDDDGTSDASAALTLAPAGRNS